MSSSFRFKSILRDFSVTRLWSAWTRSYIINTVKRYKREGGVREVLQCFRQTLLRPRRTLLLSATAAYKNSDDNRPPPCDKNITDAEIEILLSDIDGVKKLSKKTLFCTSCGKRLVIEKKLPGILYCSCKDPQNESSEDWVPYMEAEDVIIWRKEYKPGQGLYAYKVYGKYKDVRAQDFAAVQLDGAYRRVWDSAVAALSIVERRVNGINNQAVLHWEVLWPRLFANRDYVYIRRHKEFDLKNVIHSSSIENVLRRLENERPSVHSTAKRKSMESEQKEKDVKIFYNKVFIIVSKSCVHPKVPETKHAIRVSEYWSHMVIKTLEGVDQPGMEFVLTYYDEPAVGGMPSGVAAWATGRAAPTYLAKMRSAASEYGAWSHARNYKDLPDFTPFGPEDVSNEIKDNSLEQVREQDMESSKEGPELNGEEAKTKDQSTQTEDMTPTSPPTLKKPPEVKVQKEVTNANRKVDTSDALVKKDSPSHQSEGEAEKSPEEEGNNGGWWRFLYPFYYFV